MDTKTEPESEKVVSRKKAYAPTDDDYKLVRIGIEDAENGVVVSCSYELNNEIKEKMRKQRSEGAVPYFSEYCEPERHVFESKAAAKTFIMAELNDMWGKD